MSNKLWDKIRLWFYALIAANIPETSRRYVLYDLAERVNTTEDIWEISFQQMYNKLRD